MIKLLVKRSLFTLASLVTLPLILLTRIEAALTAGKSERVYGFGKELTAIVPTIFGQFIRLAYYKLVCAGIDFDVSLLLGSMIAHRDTMIRRGTIIGTYTIIGLAEIGENVRFGARVSVVSGKYQHGRPGDRHTGREVVEEYTKINIGANSWIGEGAIILADIGTNCTIGAGSVLLKEAPDNSTFMGNPARKVNLD